MTIRLILAATALAALTFALQLTVGSAFGLLSLFALISLVMIASLAAPFVCSRNSKPFWAAYSICTGFAILMAGREGDPFEVLWNLPVYISSPEPPAGGDLMPGLMVYSFLQPWIPSLVGIAGGVLFAIANRFLINHKQPSTDG